MRPGEPRLEFNMDFCHGNVIVILTCTKGEFIDPFKAEEVAVGGTGGFVLFASV